MSSRGNFKHNIDKVVQFPNIIQRIRTSVDSVYCQFNKHNQKNIQPLSQNQVWHSCCCRMPKLSNAAAMGWSSANSMLRNQAVVFIIPKSKRVPVHELLNILIVSFWREFSLFDNECMVTGSGFHRSSRAPPPSQSGLGTCLTVNFTITAMRNS